MIRVTINLEPVIVAGQLYLSTMHQSVIDRYDPMNLEDLERQTMGTIDDAEQECFVMIRNQESHDMNEFGKQTRETFPYALNIEAFRKFF